MGIEHSEKCYEVIKILKLQKHISQKITRQQALTVSENLISHKDLNDKSKIPWYILQNLIISNCEVQSLASKTSSATTGCLQVSELFSGKDQTGSKQTNEVNPLDVLVAIFLCCDDFLRQLLVEKLSVCQLGIPFLLPDINAHTSTCEVLLWATSTLRKQWKTRSGVSCKHMVTTHKLPIVSALRLGRPKMSKSAILNGVINEQKHDTFFHYGCADGNVPKIISNGMLDLTWYLPNGTEQDFPDAFTLMNLHGNASSLKNQMSLLTAISEITIVFCESDIVEEHEIGLIKSLNHQKTHLILIFDGNLNEQWKLPMQEVKKSYSDSEGKQLNLLKYSDSRKSSREIRDVLKSLMRLLNKKLRLSLEECKTIAIREKLAIDYNFVSENLWAKGEAISLLDSLEESEDKRKVSQLPLQYVSRSISNKMRERNKKKINKRQESVEMITSDIKNLRKKQSKLHYRKNNTELISKFLEFSKSNTCERKYLYSWSTMMLDKYSSKHLQPLQEELKREWERMNDDDLEYYESQVKKNIEKLQNKMFNVSVGMENLTREIAQIYEMATTLEIRDDQINLFPEHTADMLLDGHALELMDGDATYVPVIWLKEVLRCLKKKIGMKRIFVLSVLGVQGSGKSTMLNTMFGMQFAVSAGRCTKGAFAQLVALDTSLVKRTKCHYILVIDTEGLRALEIDSNERQVRDNAIATFVVGLADATIINIMGDLVTDMQDTLQIVVQAFMKMKSVKLKPSCLFVHQNVTDVSASQITSVQRVKLKEILDESTKIASKEYFPGRNLSFSNIIHFQIEKHVDYITTLWNGNPPMAPQNPNYSKDIIKVRKKVLDLMGEVNSQTIDEFQCRLMDLWNAILSEDFVFSFRNTFEIKAYNDLETFYLQTSRTFKIDAKKICDDLVDTCRKKSAIDIERDGDKIFEEHRNKFALITKDFHEAMNTYYTQCPMASRWKQENKDKVEKLARELQKTLDNEYTIVKGTVIGREEVVKKLREFEDVIHVRSLELVDKFKDSELTDSEKQQTFEGIWNNLMKTVPRHITDHINIEAEIKNILENTFNRHLDVVTNLLSNPKDMLDVKIRGDDLPPKSKSNFVKLKDLLNFYNPTDAETKKALEYKDVVLKNALGRIKKYGGKLLNCNELFLRDIVDTVHSDFKEVPSKYNVEFSHTGIVRHTTHIVWSLLKDLETIQSTFMAQNDLKMYISSQKDDLWQLFNTECTMVGNVNKINKITSVIMITFRSAIEEAIKRHFPTTVIDHFRNSPLHKNTFADKRRFHATVLIYLGEMKSFSAFTSYLDNPTYYMTRRLQQYIMENLQIDSNIQGKSVLQELYEICIEEHYSELKLAMEFASENTQSTCKDKWWECIIGQLKKITITRAPHCIDEIKNINLEELYSKLSNEVQLAEREARNTYNSKRRDLLSHVVDPTVEFFQEDLIGCEATCPFCHAPCDNAVDCQSHCHAPGDNAVDCESKETKFHRTKCHRPQGVSGRIWEENRLFRKAVQKISGSEKRDDLVVDLCTTVVKSSAMFKNKNNWHPFEKYKEVYPNWDIQPVTTSQFYWKWFMASFNQQLARFYGSNAGQIPENWLDITWESAKKELIELYELEHYK